MQKSAAQEEDKEKPTATVTETVGKRPGRTWAQNLAVKVELKLQRRRAQARRGDLAVVLQLHVRVDEILGEHVAFGKELEVVLQSLQ